MKKTIVIIVLLVSTAWANAQVGVNTTTPAATLDVVGKPAMTSALDGFIPPRITGAQLRAKTYTAAQTGAVVYVTTADTAPAGQTVNVTSTGLFSFDGSVWQVVSTPPANLPNGTGSVITINGQQQIAQEISVRMNADYILPATAYNNGNSTNVPPTAIGNIVTEIIDNYNSFTGTTTGNSFTVNANGTYLVTMNFSLQANANQINGNCYYGLWDDAGKIFVATNLETNTSLDIGNVKNFAFNVAVDLQQGKAYSFRIGQEVTGNAIVRGQLSGYPSTFFSVKRLK
jgi:hypothetical protein